jgi:type IV secretory pathway TraG/TraD family ATPase VirD4
LISNAIQLQCALDEPLTLASVSEIINSAPRSGKEADDKFWQENSKCSEACYAATMNNPDDYDAERAKSYFLNDFPSMGDRQLSGILETWEGLADPLLRSPIRQKFCTDTTFTPEDAIEGGKIIIVDLPVKEFDLAGRIAGVVVKFLFQKAVERRKAAPDTQRRPCFIWADEFQHFVTGYDMIFQQTARSSKTSTVYIGQNLPTVLSQLGGQGGDPYMRGLFGNLLTKIFHANDEEQTNKFAAGVIGEDWQNIANISAGESRSFLAPLLSGNQNSNVSVNPQLKHLILPIEFSHLRTGTKRNDRIVDAIFFQAGRKLANGKNFCRVYFKQPNR